MKIRFPERERSGRTVVNVKNLGFSFEDKVTHKTLMQRFQFACCCVDMLIITSEIASYISGLAFILQTCFTGRFYSRMQI